MYTKLQHLEKIWSDIQYLDHEGHWPQRERPSWADKVLPSLLAGNPNGTMIRRYGLEYIARKVFE